MDYVVKEIKNELLNYNIELINYSSNTILYKDYAFGNINIESIEDKFNVKIELDYSVDMEYNIALVKMKIIE